MPLWRNIAELMDYYIPPLPSVYWLDITRQCNLACLMCPQSRGLRERPAYMPLDLFQAIIDEVRPSRPLIKLYLCGEPLLHENLFEMIEYVSANACRAMLHTNAVALTEQMAERILESSLAFLSFSFDGSSPEVYERLRPPARFEQVQSNIRCYLDLRRQYGPGPHTTIEIIRMRDTDGLLESFVAEWMANGADDVRIVPYLTWHGLVEDRHVGKRGQSPFAEKAPQVGTVPVLRFKPCAAPFRHGCILSDGTAVPCCLDVNGEIPLGNVAQNCFQDIWSGNEYRRLRLQMLTGTFPPDSICARCDNITREA